MFWVVDGTRRKTDRKQFAAAQADGVKHPTKDGLVEQLWVYDSRLLKEWVHVGVIVAFDFGEDTVWLLRRVKGDWAYGFAYPKRSLVENISKEIRYRTCCLANLFGKRCGTVGFVPGSSVWFPSGSTDTDLYGTADPQAFADKPASSICSRSGRSCREGRSKAIRNCSVVTKV